MLFNHFKIGFRFLKRNKVYSIINILGLAIGIAASLLIFLFIQYESGFDTYYQNSDRIFRVVTDVNSKDGIEHYATTPPPLAPALEKNFSQIKGAVRFFGNPRMPVRFGAEKVFYESHFYFVDPNVFDIFEMKFINGNSETALNRPGTVIITESAARKYFGDEAPLGKTLHTWRDFEVTGIIEDIPQNSHFNFDFLASATMFENKKWTENWNSLYGPNGWIYTYIKVSEDCDVNRLARQVENISAPYFANQTEATGTSQTYILQPIERIHLFSNRSHEASPPGNLQDIRILTAVALIILFTACLNFIYLSTAGSATRAKEMAIRKVSGANRHTLIRQLLSESLFQIGLAALLAVGMTELSLPWFSELSGRQLSLSYFQDPQSLLIFFSFILMLGIASGSYIAFAISSFPTIQILSKQFPFSSSAGSSLFRKSLVACQFAISIMLIIGTIIIYQQVHMMKNKKLGFEKEHIVVLAVPVSSLYNFITNYEAMKSEFTAHHAIAAATASASVPGRSDMMVRDNIALSGTVKTNSHSINVLLVDHDFLSVYDIKISAGIPFSRENGGRGVLINETAARTLGFNTQENAVGKTIFSSNAGADVEITGVCRDFNYESLYKPVDALILDIFPDCFVYLSLKLNQGNKAEAMHFIQSKWAELFPGNPLDYFFLDDTIDRQYQAIERFGKIVFLFSTLAIFIASLGLYGLIFFLTQQRTKEIGIRKVLGASVPGIFLLFTKQILFGTVLAALAAWPIASYVMNQWLQNFAYRILFSFWILILSTLIVMTIALFTVSYKSIRAALANPVESLRYE